jgi:hypothetical protein
MRDFTGLLRSEWTKLRSVPRWLITLGAAVGISVLVAVLSAAGAQVGGGGPPGQADSRFVDRELTGDGEIVAHVVSQEGNGGWAKAGLILRTGEAPHLKYVAVMVTPGHGTRMRTDGGKDVVAGNDHWLKLTRSGSTVTGYSSADGSTWKKIGTAKFSGTARLGVFAASPAKTKLKRQFGSESIDSLPSEATAVFDGVSPALDGKTTLTVTGHGDVGPDLYADDHTQAVLTGILLGIVAVVAVAVLTVTSEYRRGMALTTFTITPRRGLVLAARTLVIGATTFVVGVVAAYLSLLVALPMLPKQFVAPSVTDPVVLRAIFGTGLLVALIAAFGAGLATLFRNTAAAVSVALVSLLLPEIVATGLPLSAARWLTRLTPAAGFAIQRTVPRYDTAIGPWAGLGVLALYAALTLALAARLLAKRDA